VPAAPGYAAPAYTPAAPANSLAVVGFVMALGGLVISLGGLTSLAGAIISCIALARASRMRAQGLANHRYGMALAGVISGFLIFLLVVLAIVFLVIFTLNHPAGSSDPFNDSSLSDS
jgi:Cu/Ag efflux pump CusA